MIALRHLPTLLNVDVDVIYIEEYFTIKLAILCEKIRKKLMSIFIELAIYIRTLHAAGAPKI